MRTNTTIVGAASAALLVIALAGCTSSETASEGTPEPTETVDFPTDTVRLIIGQAPGGSTDTLARAHAECLSELWGQPVVVENIEGANGARANGTVASADPDGHTIVLMGQPGSTINVLSGNVDYDLDDIQTLGIVGTIAGGIGVKEDARWADAEEFFEEIEKNPGKITVGVTGPQASHALELLRLRDIYGLEVTVVPFQGSAEVATAVLGGTVDAVFAGFDASLTEGLRPIAVSGPTHLEGEYADLPILPDLGFDELTLATSSFVFGTAAETPAEVLDVLEAGFEECSHSDSVLAAAEIVRIAVPDFGGREASEELITSYETDFGPVLEGLK